MTGGPTSGARSRLLAPSAFLADWSGQTLLLDAPTSKGPSPGIRALVNERDWVSVLVTRVVGSERE